MEKPWNKYSLL